MFTYLSRPSIIPKAFSIVRASNISRNQQRGIKKTKIFESNTKIYTDKEEWLYETYEATKMGLSNNAISQLSELVYIEFLHEKGNVVKKNEDLVIVESVKATDEIKAPFDCVILGINNEVEDSIETFLDKINQSPECTDESWIIKIDKIP